MSNNNQICSVKNMQQIIIENLLTKCKRESVEEDEDSDNNYQMVGYYATGVPEDSRLVVCSPDLPITVATQPIKSVSPPITITNIVYQEASNMLAVSGPTAMTNGGLSTIKRNATVKDTNGAITAEDPYQCNICSKTFAVPARLTRHYRTHTGEKPFQCEYCAKSFSVKENLSVHRRIHTKERPYKCEVCARAFEHSGKLHRHMRIHTGERPHKCTVCSKTFIQSGQLVIHMRTHTGEKPYVCTVCSKGFTCSKQLKVHSRTHTGEKPYACDICGKSFGYNHVLKLHQVAHYGEKVYKCTICNDTFNSKKCMEAHIKSHSDNTNSNPNIANSTSDKENSELSHPVQTYEENREIRYYINDYQTMNQYTTSGVDLLAAAASATEDLTRDEDVINLITNHNSRKMNQSPVLRHPVYYSHSQPVMTYDAGIDNGNDIRRRVEAALAVASSEEEPLLTPPSSNPVSPAPSPSPDPVQIVVARAAISLPPRKRSKMILKSMEIDEVAPTAVRYSSVIHYARAS